MSNVPWLDLAREHKGLREIPGALTEPKIASWLKRLGAWWNDDETPWCGTFVAAMMIECSIALPKHWYRAKGWLDWGVKLAAPVVGCVVVFDRKGGGHVAFVVGQDERGRLMCVGGNQGNAVSDALFEKSRVLGYRWPPSVPPPVDRPLPFVVSTGKSSTNEA